jgi:hypothetical protein
LREHFLESPAIYIHFRSYYSKKKRFNIFLFIMSLLLGSGGTGDNLDQLAGNDGLASAVEQNLELVDHLAGVLGGVVHGVATGGLLAGVALGKSPEEGVGQGVLAEAGEDGLVNLEGREVGWIVMLVSR